MRELTYDKIGKFSDVIQSDRCIICKLNLKKMILLIYLLVINIVFVIDV